MELLYIGCTHFKEKSGEWFSLPSSGNEFFQNFLGVFDSIRVVGTGMPEYIGDDSLVKITDKRIFVISVPNTNNPFDIIVNQEMTRALEDEIQKADAILIKPANHRGIKAINIAKKKNKPYMIYLTGDIKSQLLTSKSLIRKMYGYYIYYATKRAIRDCKFGLYISKKFLQNMYPIMGDSFSCADVVIPDTPSTVLESRKNKILSRNIGDIYNIALIGFYHGNAKGIDTAIEALSELGDKYHLNILGFGMREHQQKWIDYGSDLGIHNRIHFPEPKHSSVEVLTWLDTQDLFVLPSRSEGFGRVIVEAMSRGCPCICTNVCTIPEIVPDKWLIEIGDAKKLSRLIQEVSQNKITACDCADVNFNIAKEYSYDHLTEKRKDVMKKFKDYCLSQGNKV